jgi:AbrB family looped-hinge helix DNA binding protein
MDLIVDKLGRVVIPKALRQRLHLQPGTRLRVSESDHGFSLEPVAETSAGLVDKGGILVFSGAVATGDMDVANILRQIRDERDRKAWDGDAQSP